MRSLIPLFIVIVLLPPVGHCQKLTRDQWIADIEVFREQISTRYNDFFLKVDEAYFNDQLNTLERRIDSLPRDIVLMKLSQLLSRAGELRLSLSFRVSYLYPIYLRWFTDGMHVVGLPKKHRKHLKSRVVSINGVEVDVFRDSLCNYVYPCAEGDVGRYVREAPRLALMGMPVEYLTLELEDESGSRTNLKLERATRTAASFRIPKQYVRPRKKFLHSKDKGLWFWAETLSDSVLYIRYRKCQSREHKKAQQSYNKHTDAQIAAFPSWEDFTLKVIASITTRTKKVIIDLRDNWGGNVKQGEHLIQQLDSLSSKNNFRLIGITNGGTRSAAMRNAHFLQRKGGTWISVPIDGRLKDHEGSWQFKLPNSGATVYFPKPHNNMGQDDETLLPDVILAETFGTFITGTDPLLEKALELP